jgi:hypothetical protein
LNIISHLNPFLSEFLLFLRPFLCPLLSVPPSLQSLVLHVTLLSLCLCLLHLCVFPMQFP